MDEKYLDTKGVGELLSVRPRTVAERYSKVKGFPEAIYLPAGDRGMARKRWRMSEIIQWMETTSD